MLPAKAESEDGAQRRISPRRRLAAAAALLLGAATVIVTVVALVQDPLAGLLALLGLFLAVQLAWQSALQSGAMRVLLLLAAVAAVLAALAALAAADLIADLLLVAGGVLVTAFAVRTAFGPGGSAGGRWRPAPRPSHPVLLINPHSGDGRAERGGLADEARQRGIEAVVLGPDDDLAALAREALDGGADAIGMAGGDGSLAIVAAIAAERDIPFVCIPAGTRNHFALDLGVRRDDLIGALDAFTDGVESRVDLGVVNGRTFVNNVSLGVYGEAVQDPEYRDAKLKTLQKTIGPMLSSTDAVSSMQVTDDLGNEHASAAVMLVSNNAYALRRVLGRSTRPRIDGGRLGIVVVGPRQTDRAWDAPDVTVTTPGTTAVAIDGEAATLTSPLEFSSTPGKLRVRIAAHHPGVSPSGLLPPTLAVTVPRLASMALGR